MPTAGKKSPERISPKDGWRPPHPNRLRAIRRRLREFYGVPVPKQHHDPVGELVLTVLSQNTNDRNRDIAFSRLEERWSSWEAVRAAPVEQIEAAIAPGGISKVKSARIKQILERVATDPLPVGALPGGAEDAGAEGARAGAGHAGAGSGMDVEGARAGVGHAGAGSGMDGERPPTWTRTRELDLGWLAQAPLTVSRDYLCSLPGVARKTAACVLLFAYGLPDIPVDTHVGRVGSRLGTFRPGASFEEMHDTMLAITPSGLAHEAHVNMIRHGRRLCHARSPRCTCCPLRDICPSAGSFVSKKA